MAVHDRLRPARRPRREQHEQRVVERDREELERPRLGEQLVPGERIRNGVLAVGDVRRRGAASGGRRGSSPARRDGRSSGRGSRSRRPRAAPWARAGRGGRRRCGRRARARSSPRPPRGSPRRRTPPGSRGCSACRRRPGRRGGRRACARPARARATCSRKPANVSSDGSRVWERETTATRSASSSRADQVLGEIQARAGEPRGARHRRGGEDGAVRRVRLHLEELPDRRPERRQVVDRPAPQLLVAREGEPALALEPGEIAPDLGRLPNVRRRRPQDAGVVAREKRHQAGASLCPIPCEMSRAVRVTDGP